MRCNNPRNTLVYRFRGVKMSGGRTLEDVQREADNVTDEVSSPPYFIASVSHALYILFLYLSRWKQPAAWCRWQKTLAKLERKHWKIWMSKEVKHKRNSCEAREKEREREREGEWGGGVKRGRESYASLSLL